MGSFSWLKADKQTKVKNVAFGKSFKFGGGFIKIMDIWQIKI